MTKLEITGSCGCNNHLHDALDRAIKSEKGKISYFIISLSNYNLLINNKAFDIAKSLYRGIRVQKGDVSSRYVNYKTTW